MNDSWHVLGTHLSEIEVPVLRTWTIRQLHVLAKFSAPIVAHVDLVALIDQFERERRANEVALDPSFCILTHPMHHEHNIAIRLDLIILSLILAGLNDSVKWGLDLEKGELPFFLSVGINSGCRVRLPVIAINLTFSFAEKGTEGRIVIFVGALIFYLGPWGVYNHIIAECQKEKGWV